MMMRLSSSALIVFALTWQNASAWCTSCGDVCTNYGYAKGCRSPYCTVQDTSCSGKPSSCNSGLPYCGYCACNFFGCNCDPCGACGYSESQRNSTVKDNHAEYMSGDVEQRLKHLGVLFDCGAGSVTMDFEKYLLQLADKNQDGEVTKDEFDTAHVTPDLTEWPVEMRCQQEALVQCGEIKKHYKAECCGKDGGEHSDHFDAPCAHVKAHYKHEEGCGNPDKTCSMPPHA